MYHEKTLLKDLRDPARREGAFTQLVQEHQQQLYWQIRRMVSSHDDADDILQNVFLKAWQALDSFRGDASLSTWLYRITSNETLSFIQRKRPTVSLDRANGGNDDDALPPVQLEADEYFDGDETQRQFQEAISTLPPKQREVFTLKYFKEMRYEDMSELLGTSVGALKASYFHAVGKITRYFESLD